MFLKLRAIFRHVCRIRKVSVYSFWYFNFRFLDKDILQTMYDFVITFPQVLFSDINYFIKWFYRINKWTKLRLLAKFNKDIMTWKWSVCEL